MKAFEIARESLIELVREQIIGPGAYNKQLFFLKEWEQNEFSGLRLRDQRSLDNSSEVIPELPAYQYSSAILFPEVEIVQEVTSPPSPIDYSDDTDDQVDSSADDEKIISKEMDGVSSKQQNYPTSFGLTFVTNDGIELSADVEVVLNYRTYKKIRKKDLIDRGLSLWISEYEEEIKQIIDLYLNDLIKWDQKDGNIFLSLKSNLELKDFYDLDYLCLNKYLKEKIIKDLQDAFKNELKTLSEDEKFTKIGLKSEREIIFFIITKQKDYQGFKYQDVYKIDENLIRFLKSALKGSLGHYSQYKRLIKNLEIFEQIKQKIGLLKAIYKENKPLSVWESKFHSHRLILPDLDPSQRIFRSPEPYEIESSEGLCFSIQYIRKSGVIYVKLVILNKNQIRLSATEPPQLNKKDEANQKSFFGIELMVTESKSELLLPYNPPQLIDFDEEDSFNKLLYRKYKDFGEGYNCSITWGIKDNKRYIGTEYLPEQETPKIGFIPKRISSGNIERRLHDEKVLSFKYLSTLSEESDESIIESLKSFIASYADWIDEKEGELTDLGLEPKEIRILNKQIRGCRKDQKRLKRNVHLLENDPAGMASFRLMNTAMLMQLHHGDSQRKSRPFIPYDDRCSGEDRYKNGDIPNYTWRSFQLAFILLNIDAFIKPIGDEGINDDVFQTGWPERNEIADLVWFPTGGGKTEAYLGVIAFMICHRRFTKGVNGFGTSVLMRYTLRLLTLQQFQRAALLICALEVIRKESFHIPYDLSLGEERITIGLFVGGDSLPNTWIGDKSMKDELAKIASQIGEKRKISTNIPFTECPWCGGELFINEKLPNVNPNHLDHTTYGKSDKLNLSCNSQGCSYYSRRPTDDRSLPLRLFDEDIYKFPPTLLFGTVDKFATLANKVSTTSIEGDSRRLFGKRTRTEIPSEVFPPELIIQDELHLLLGPLGSAVGIFERGVEHLCSYEQGGLIRPKIITSTATTRNTDKQIFALFKRRAEIFPKQGIFCDDSFFSFFERKEDNVAEYDSNRKYVGVLPIGKTQVWMQLRLASIALAHRVKYLRERYTLDELLEEGRLSELDENVLDYYFTVLSYYNSLKDVGKTQSQLTHYLPGDLSYITKNILPWNFLDQIIREIGVIDSAELTGRLTGEEVKSSLSKIQQNWRLIITDRLNEDRPPEFVMATNMISVGIDVGRFNTMLVNSMPRNIAEYIQATSRVARQEKGVVFTIHHPFRSRDISHYQKYKEFHEKFYSYVEPISVTPFAKKALDRYLAMLIAVYIRHSEVLGLSNNEDAGNLNYDKIQIIQRNVKDEVQTILNNALALDKYLRDREDGVRSNMEGIISIDEINTLNQKVQELLGNWISRIEARGEDLDLKYRISQNEPISKSLFTHENIDADDTRWKVGYSLREVGPSTVIRTVQQ